MGATQHKMLSSICIGHEPNTSPQVQRLQCTLGCQRVEAVLHVTLHHFQPVTGVIRLHGLHTAAQQLQLVLQGNQQNMHVFKT